MRNIATRYATIVLFLTSLQTLAQEFYPVKLSDKLWRDEERELRYKPDGTDLVITNGNRLFTLSNMVLI